MRSGVWVVVLGYPIRRADLRLWRHPGSDLIFAGDATENRFSRARAAARPITAAAGWSGSS